MERKRDGEIQIERDKKRDEDRERQKERKTDRQRETQTQEIERDIEKTDKSLNARIILFGNCFAKIKDL